MIWLNKEQKLFLRYHKLSACMYVWRSDCLAPKCQNYFCLHITSVKSLTMHIKRFLEQTELAVASQTHCGAQKKQCLSAVGHFNWYQITT